MSEKILFVIPSVIHFTDNPLNYNNIRSVFTPEERTLQTIKSIESVRSKVPEADILLIEMGLKDVPVLSELVDHYLYIGDDPKIREVVDGPYKGLGEAMGLLAADELIRTIEPTYCFKLSGRYFLDDYFRLSKWDMNKLIMKQQTASWRCTRLYGVPASQYEAWMDALKTAIPSLEKGKPIENLFWILLTQAHNIRRLGVSGIVAPLDAEVAD